jgi:hypothetical protein
VRVDGVVATGSIASVWGRDRVSEGDTLFSSQELLTIEQCFFSYKNQFQL